MPEGNASTLCSKEMSFGRIARSLRPSRLKMNGVAHYGDAYPGLTSTLSPGHRWLDLALSGPSPQTYSPRTNLPGVQDDPDDMALWLTGTRKPLHSNKVTTAHGEGTHMHACTHAHMLPSGLIIAWMS